MTKTGTKTVPFGPDHLDVRVRERFIGNGVLDRKDLEAHLAALPDVADQGEIIQLDQPAILGVYGAMDDEEEEEGE